MSVCRSLRTQFRRTWQSPSNAHAYRLYVVNEPLSLNVASLLRLACPLRSAKPSIMTEFSAFRQPLAVFFLLGNRLDVEVIAASSEAAGKPHTKPASRTAAAFVSTFRHPTRSRSAEPAIVGRNLHAGQPIGLRSLSGLLVAPLAPRSSAQPTTIAPYGSTPDRDALSYVTPLTESGSDRRRFPVRANSALATAGAIGGTPGSPTPLGARSLATIHVSTLGAEAAVSIG